MSANLPALAYAGAIIHERGEMLSLTDMWRAAGADEHKAPAKWRSLTTTKAFAEFVAVTVGKSDSDIFVTNNGGRSQGTWAHWHLGMAYAKYLSPEFHMWCNTVVRERMEGGARQAAPLTLADLRQTVAGLIESELAAKTLLIRRGKTAGQIWQDAGFPPCRLVGWFSHRLREVGCQIEGGGRAELGTATRLVFDPDKAATWLRHGGRFLVERKVAERRGQGVLRLVVG